jgi:RimJ/RimL family protein N-acetyltransferase
MNIELRGATPDDVELIQKLQIEANQAYLEKYQDYDVNPACESLERIRERFADFRDHFFIVADGEIVGTIRTAWWTGTGRYRLGGISVAPAFQNKGIGGQAIRQTEALYPQAETWELDTILQEPRLLHLYEKLGYQREGEPEVVNERMSLVFMKKTVEKAREERS